MPYSAHLFPILIDDYVSKTVNKVYGYSMKLAIRPTWYKKRMFGWKVTGSKSIKKLLIILKWQWRFEWQSKNGYIKATPDRMVAVGP